MSSQTQKIIISIVGLAAAGFAVYYYYFNPSISIDLSMTTDSAQVGGDVLVLANKIKTVNINPDILSSPLFSNLKDFSVSINPEQMIRPNPFLPIGTENTTIVVPTNIRTPGNATSSNNI